MSEFQPSAAPTAEQALILAAIELFGREGYAAVGIRALSERAGTNLSGIKYHFGGKEALYRAAVVYVTEQLRPRVTLALNAFEEGRRLAGDDRARQVLLIRGLVANLLQLFLASKDLPHFMPFVLREFFLPGPNFDLFYEALPRRLHELFTGMVAMVEGTDPQDSRTITRAHAILGQIMIFHVGRPILFKRQGWTEFNAERIDAIVREVQSLLIRSLGLEAWDGEGAGP